MARNRAFTPFDPTRMVSPIPARLATSDAQEARLRAMGVPSASQQAFERSGADYPYPAPQVIQTRVDLDDGLAALIAGGTITLAGFRMFKNTAADRLRFFISTANPDTFSLLRFQLQVNGQSFVQQQFFTLPFIVNMQPFYREIKSQASVAIVAGLQPGAAPLPPLGTIETQIFVDSYQAKFQ